jgi:hypothetical protein
MARRRIVIQGLEPIATFDRKDGSKGRVLRVRACTVEGVPIGERLKTFSTLPVGRELDVDVRVDDHARYGRSYIVSLPRGRNSERLDQLELRVAVIEERLGIGRAAA